MTIRAVLFDLDNTLLLEDESTFAALRRACALAGARAAIDPDALFASLVRAAQERWRSAPIFDYAEAMGIWWGEGLWGEFAGDPPGLRALRAFVPRFRRDAWRAALAAVGVSDDALADELANEYRAARRAGQLVDPEAESVLDALAREHRLALVTNGAPDVQREKLATTALASRFGAILISAEAGVGKPDPRIFRLALDALGARSDQAVMVGDSLSRDVAGAHAAGLRAVWIDRAMDEPVPEPRPDPDAVIRALSELPAALAALAPAGASPRGSRAPRPA